MPRTKRTRRNIDPFIEAQATDERTLDVGCRRAPYRRHFPNSVGLDLRIGKQIHLIGDACAMPVASESFGCVLMAEVLEHVSDPPAALREARRVLWPGGRLILCVPFIFPIHDAPDDFHRWTHHGLRMLLERAGFEIEILRHDHGTMETLSLMLHRVALQSTRSAWSPTRWVLNLLSALVGLFRDMPLSEHGDTKRRHREQAILTAGYLVLAKRPT